MTRPPPPGGDQRVHHRRGAAHRSQERAGGARWDAGAAHLDRDLALSSGRRGPAGGVRLAGSGWRGEPGAAVPPRLALEEARRRDRAPPRPPHDLGVRSRCAHALAVRGKGASRGSGAAVRRLPRTRGLVRTPSVFLPRRKKTRRRRDRAFRRVAARAHGVEAVVGKPERLAIRARGGLGARWSPLTAAARLPPARRLARAPSVFLPRRKKTGRRGDGGHRARGLGAHAGAAPRETWKRASTAVKSVDGFCTCLFTASPRHVRPKNRATTRPERPARCQKTFGRREGRLRTSETSLTAVKGAVDFENRLSRQSASRFLEPSRAAAAGAPRESGLESAR